MNTKALKQKEEEVKKSRHFQRDKWLKEVNETAIKNKWDICVLPIQSKKFAKMEEKVSYNIIKRTITTHSKLRRFKNPYQQKLLKILRVITILLTEEEMKRIFMFPSDLNAMVEVNKIKKIIEE